MRISRRNHHGYRVSPNPTTAVLIEKREGCVDTETYREENHVKTGAKIGHRLLSQEVQELPETGRGEKGFSLPSSVEVWSW